MNPIATESDITVSSHEVGTFLSLLSWYVIIIIIIIIISQEKQRLYWAHGNEEESVGLWVIPYSIYSGRLTKRRQHGPRPTPHAQTGYIDLLGSMDASLDYEDRPLS